MSHAKKSEIILYSTKDCPWCKKTKQLLKDHHIRFKEIDVGTNTKAGKDMIKKSGQSGVPVLDIKGTILVGFEERDIRKELGLPRRFKLW